MPNLIKFIHTADIHLGKKLSYNGEPGPELSNILSTAVETAFSRLVKLAIQEKVDFIVIAGDLYDRETHSIKASSFFRQQCLLLAEEDILVYIISGNHDPAAEINLPFSLPENVCFFSSEEVEIKEYKKDGKTLARILGQSYRQKFESRSMYNFYTPADNNVFNLALLHTALEPESRRYVPVSQSDLISKKEINYWALGHIHYFQLLNKSPHICYSGTIQGRDTNEIGSRGAVMVEVDENFSIKTKLCQLAPVVYQELNLDLEKLAAQITNLSELEQLLNNESEKLLTKLTSSNQDYEYQEQLYIVRYLIKGRSAVNKFLVNDQLEIEAELLEQLRKNFSSGKTAIWPDSLAIRTANPLPNLAKLKQNNDIFQELDLMLAKFGNETKFKHELLAEWGKIWQGDQDQEDREIDRFYPEEKFINEILAEAEKIIISELFEDGD